MTWAPTASNLDDQLTLVSSSNRAMSSIATVTSLPFSAARIRASIISDLSPVLYMVCLIDKTCGSLAASLSKSTIGSKES